MTDLSHHHLHQGHVTAQAVPWAQSGHPGRGEDVTMTVGRFHPLRSQGKTKAARAGRRAGVLAAATVLGSGIWLAAPAAQAATSHCLIINAATDTSYTSLQAAQDAASTGATLRVRGTCTGSTEITKNLTLTGQQPAGFTTPTLNGGGQGSVLTIDSGVAVTINTLTITGGSAGSGGGIRNFGTVTVNGASITGNNASGANAPGGGGGINNNGTVTLNNSSVTGNTARIFGGGIDNLGGTVTLSGTNISGNTAGDAGGGIYNDGTVSLNDSSSITGNTAGIDGGGIANNLGGTVTLNGSASITGNKPDNCAPPGSVPGCAG